MLGRHDDMTLFSHYLIFDGLRVAGHERDAAFLFPLPAVSDEHASLPYVHQSGLCSAGCTAKQILRFSTAAAIHGILMG